MMGFWEYSTPGAGGAERYTSEDYRLLLDDMAQHGFTSLLLVIKWLTTGYRSSLPFLDQDETNAVIASDNRILHEMLAYAAEKNIDVVLGAVVTLYPTDVFGGMPHTTVDSIGGFPLPSPVGLYDSDHPRVVEHAIEVAEDIVTQFPTAAGLMIELEFSSVETDERAQLYDDWARANDRPLLAELPRRLDPRFGDVNAWREFTTDSRIAMLTRIESAVRARGFEGKMITICETDNAVYSVRHETALDRIALGLPGWQCVFYEYDKWRHRETMMDFCVDQPAAAGLDNSYLARGVMTWSSDGSQPLPLTLEQSWAMDIEDIAAHHPPFTWWFGSGGPGEGAHCSETLLAEAGYADGHAARAQLLRMVAESGAA